MRMAKGLGLRLENLRDKSEFSQKDISSILGFSPNTYGQYEREERDPSIGTLIKLAEFFNVSLDYMLRGEDYKIHANFPPDDTAIKEVSEVLEKHGINNPYTLSSNKDIYEEYTNNLTQSIAVTEVLDVFKKHEIKDPYILKSKQWDILSRDDLMSLTKHFEWTVFQADSDK